MSTGWERDREETQKYLVRSVNNLSNAINRLAAAIEVKKIE
jgi:hypothetical protein